jgi:uncharacterized membrane protein
LWIDRYLINELYAIYIIIYRKKNESNKLGKLAMIAVAAGVLTFGPISVNVDDALAAKTGGRIGGQSFRSSAPRPSSPRINNNNSRYLYISTNSYSVSSFQGNLNIVCWILTLTQLEEECCL